MIKAILFDYGAGNLHSLGKALEAGGAIVRIEPDPALILDGDVVVLPGVGAFGAAAERLAPAREIMRSALADGFPCLGVCLGMQLLFDESDEGPGVSGLGVFRGNVRRLRGARVPHMGWNEVVAARKGEPDPVLAGSAPLIAYFANSFVAEPAVEDEVIAWTTYGEERFAAAVRRGRTVGVQFHPEKSGVPGLRLIRDFLAEVAG